MFLINGQKIHNYMDRVSPKRHATTYGEHLVARKTSRGDNDGRLLLLRGICGKTSPRARVPPLRYLALHKSAENGTSGFRAI